MNTYRPRQSGGSQPQWETRALQSKHVVYTKLQKQTCLIYQTSKANMSYISTVKSKHVVYIKPNQLSVVVQSFEPSRGKTSACTLPNAEKTLANITGKGLSGLFPRSCLSFPVQNISDCCDRFAYQIYNVAEIQSRFTLLRPERARIDIMEVRVSGRGRLERRCHANMYFSIHYI
jgi:hypothetical protein